MDGRVPVRVGQSTEGKIFGRSLLDYPPIKSVGCVPVKESRITNGPFNRIGTDLQLYIYAKISGSNLKIGIALGPHCYRLSSSLLFPILNVRWGCL